MKKIDRVIEDYKRVQLPVFSTKEYGELAYIQSTGLISLVRSVISRSEAEEFARWILDLYSEEP